jgi:hypothetical protein
MKPVGETDEFSGDVTTLNLIGPRPPAAIEKSLGFQAGRLAEGYWVVVLCDPLTPGDFQFSGTPMRSGGRLGLPAATAAADRLRPRVHDQILGERGTAGYEALQRQVLRTAMTFGPHRIAKVIPATRHSSTAAPSDQYPMGGSAGLQWTLVRKKKFLIAMQVGPDNTATTPGFTVSLAEGQPNL